MMYLDPIIAKWVLAISSTLQAVGALLVLSVVGKTLANGMRTAIRKGAAVVTDWSLWIVLFALAYFFVVLGVIRFNIKGNRWAPIPSPWLKSLLGSIGDSATLMAGSHEWLAVPLFLLFSLGLFLLVVFAPLYLLTGIVLLAGRVHARPPTIALSVFGKIGVAMTLVGVAGQALGSWLDLR